MKKLEINMKLRLDKVVVNPIYQQDPYLSMELETGDKPNENSTTFHA